MADDVSTTVRSMVERVLEADLKDQIARRSQEVAKAVTEATDAAAGRAGEAWRDSAPTRRDAERAMRKASRDASKWGRRTWQRDLRPALRDLWTRRTAAYGAASAAIPASRELVQDAAVRMGMRRREERHWTAFFFGLLLGAVAGAAIALLTAPKPGRQVRGNLADAARDAAARAREAAGGASEWVPLFERPATNGGAISEGFETSPVQPAETIPAAESIPPAVAIPATEPAQPAENITSGSPVSDEMTREVAENVEQAENVQQAADAGEGTTADAVEGDRPV
jgi:YtxH-like protein